MLASLAIVILLFGGILMLLLVWWLLSRDRAEHEGATMARAPEIILPQDQGVGEGAEPAVEAAPELAAMEAADTGDAATESTAEDAPEAAETEEAAEPATDQPDEPDDLKRIEGIGPKIASVLQAAGIATYARLADTEVERLEEILEADSPRLRRLAHPGTWPEQAALAAAGEWEALAALQGTLKRGRA
jgi:predicted flap endonuclease-1-like 5' DNA nuclease